MNLREWALPVYTILMQLSIGALFSLWVVRTLKGLKYGQEKMDQITTIPVLIIFSTIILALIGSHFHLSRPFLSFLAIRNFRHSWLSREITFTIFVFVCTAILSLLLWFRKGNYHLRLGLGWGAILAGLATVYCMASIYLLPAQVAWNSTVTIISYYAVTLLLGTTSLIVILLMDLRFLSEGSPADLDVNIKIVKESIVWLTVATVIGALLVIGTGIYQIELLRSTASSSAQASLKLILDLYKPLFIMRMGLTALGVIWLVGIVTHYIKKQKLIMNLLGPVYIACILVLIGEILERFLFYATHVRIGI
jgi:anaerobic dimethyl sulfoxide reductase subunit C (anchor subunit)